MSNLFFQTVPGLHPDQVRGVHPGGRPHDPGGPAAAHPRGRPHPEQAHVPLPLRGADRARGGHRATPGLAPGGARPADAGRTPVPGQKIRVSRNFIQVKDHGSYKV